MNSIHRRLLVINLDNPELLEEGAVMTENEAKVFIQNAMEQSRNALAELMLIMPKVFAVMEKNLGEYYSNLENCKKEIQACEVAIKTLEEVQQYHAIGTLEECQAAVEKQTTMEPIRMGKCTCPSCGTHNEVWKKRRNTLPSDIVYCWHCGQAVEIKRSDK